MLPPGEGLYPLDTLYPDGTIIAGSAECLATTPWTPTNHPFTINRLRPTYGGATDQSTGEWLPEATNNGILYGSIGRGTTRGSGGLHAEDLTILAGGQFKTGDQYFVCHTGCDVALNDILEVYDDAAGSSKVYWRVITKLKELGTFKNLRGFGQEYWLVRMEER